MALRAAREACGRGGAVVIVDGDGGFYPPAAVRLGIAAQQMVVVRVERAADVIWTLDQALRCVGVAAVVAWLEGVEGRAFRRLQLAVEEGGGLGLLVRPERARGEPSWADVRLLVEPLATDAAGAKFHARIHVLRARGAGTDKRVEVEVDDEAGAVRLAAQLAHPTASRRAVGG